MKKQTLTDLPNIGKTIAAKLNAVGIYTEHDLQKKGSEKALQLISTLENSGVCINMLYALEGAIQGIRWHQLSAKRKRELLDFYRLIDPV
ncbi:MAG: TfoX/Sxy family protein [Bacteroidetes bacterium]|nr:TfoX/Sxy family protein [Bacteroidota bacterium]